MKIQRDKTKTVQEQIMDLKDSGFAHTFVAESFGVKPFEVASLWLPPKVTGLTLGKTQECLKLLKEGEITSTISKKLKVNGRYISAVWAKLEDKEREKALKLRAKNEQELRDKVSALADQGLSFQKIARKLDITLYTVVKMIGKGARNAAGQQ